jgi:hypothetical protein
MWIQRRNLTAAGPVVRALGFSAFIAAAAAFAPARAEGQRGSLGMWGGVSSALGPSPTVSSGSNSLERGNSLAGGARLTFWRSNVLGFEMVGGLTPSKSVAGATVNRARSLSVFAGGLKLMVGLSPTLSPVGLHIGAGPAIVRRGKGVRTQSSSETNLGGVVGAGLRFPIASGLGMRLDVEDYVSKGTSGGIRKTWNFLVTSAGLTIAF